MLTKPLMPPQASINPQSKANNWFSINAKAIGHATIKIYDEIGRWGIGAKAFSEQLTALGEVQTIELRIHSPGGDVFEGLAIYNLLKQHPAKIVGYIDGLAASMASVIAMACDELNMPANSFLMVHKPWGIQGGNADAMRDYADLLDKCELPLQNAYAAKTGKRPEDIAALLNSADETWLSGTEALAEGFCDYVIEDLQVAACLNHQLEHTMPASLKGLMQPKAQTPAAAPQDPAPQGALPTPTAPPAADPVAVFKAQNTQRVTQINALFAAHQGHDKLHSECVADVDCSLENAQSKLLAAIGAGTTPTASAHIRADNGNIVKDGLTAALQARCGMDVDAQGLTGNPYRGMTLAEMARASLTEKGIGVAGFDRQEVVAQAFTHTSGDFGHILQDTTNKSMLKGFTEAGETFPQWTSRGVLTDFKPSKRADISSFPTLQKVAEGAEYTHGTIGDRGESIMLATYGKLLSITRQTIINDDLQALTRIPMLMGRAAIRTVGDLVYAVLLANPKMSDGKALFHADHKNQLAAAALTQQYLENCRNGMQLQADGDAVLNILPQFLLSPVALQGTLQSLISAQYDEANPELRAANRIGNFVQVISDARLDKAPKDFYLAANGGMYDTIEVAYLDGNDRPYLEQQQGFTRDGVLFKVRMDAGVAPMSHRTLFKGSST